MRIASASFALLFAVLPGMGIAQQTTLPGAGSAEAHSAPADPRFQSIDGYTLPTLSTTAATQARGPAVGFTLRGGLAGAPGYFGDDDLELGPDLGFSLNYLNLGGFRFGDPDPLFRGEGVGLRGSFRFVPERDDADFDELAGLDDVDATLEAGLGLAYTGRNYEVFADARYGFFGHEAFVGELGGDVIARPGTALTLRAGPRLLLGTDDYAETYFGVSPGEAAGSGIPAFDASGGLMSVGVELGADYALTEDWGISAAIRVDELQDDAADSPIVQDDTQLRARIGVTRRFTFGF